MISELHSEVVSRNDLAARRESFIRQVEKEGGWEAYVLNTRDMRAIAHGMQLVLDKLEPEKAKVEDISSKE